ncbi:hypothetical protein [Variovorax sp. JS1663]|uniref:hypothetical protein n=1 Tax=Variovorax sp. JS1663 TaxID=1851577 RepID=UPI000B342474|nr:hypothetical protein [Variovorax sp. JS1663]OUM02024.1 hypothetical protein A8M77_13010 [Variovorax sp. JS1663]
MPSTRSPVRDATRGTRVLLQGPSSYAEAAAPPSHAQLCERTVQAIWHILDEHDLLDEQVRSDLAAMLEPLAAPAFGDRPQRLIKILRQPNPIDPSHLYWLTRRLLTLVPELQAAALSSKGLM